MSFSREGDFRFKALEKLHFFVGPRTAGEGWVCGRDALVPEAPLAVAFPFAGVVGGKSMVGMTNVLSSSVELPVGGVIARGLF